MLRTLTVAGFTTRRVNTHCNTAVYTRQLIYSAAPAGVFIFSPESFYSQLAADAQLFRSYACVLSAWSWCYGQTLNLKHSQSFTDHIYLGMSPGNGPHGHSEQMGAESTQSQQRTRIQTLSLLPNETEISEINAFSGLFDCRLVGWKVCVCVWGGLFHLQQPATRRQRRCSEYVPIIHYEKNLILNCFTLIKYCITE